MDATFELKIYLPVNRWEPGYARLYEPGGARLLYDIPCRGKSDGTNARRHGNPGRDPTRPWGDTPAGDYEPIRFMRYDPAHRTFGLLALLLEGTSGDALEAKKNGRTGLACHGGRGSSNLMATYGCVRFFDRDLGMIRVAVGEGLVKVTVIDCPAWPPS